jgi:outer membrane receptor for ferrienterochelin and colicins
MFARRPPCGLANSLSAPSRGGWSSACLIFGLVPALAAADDEPLTVDEEVIVVTGTKTERPRQASPVTTEVIDRKRLEESGTQTASEALALRAGLWIERGVAGTSGVTMQGLGPQYSLVLVDGARQIGRTDGTLDLDRFATDDLEQIEIVRGPASVLYGSDALGGVINLVTKTPKDGIAIDALGRVDGRLGYEARARIAVGRGTYGGSLTVGHRTADAIVDGDSEDGATFFDAYDDTHGAAKAVVKRSDWRFDAAADYSRRDLRGVTATATGAVLDQRNLVETATSRAMARWSGDKTALQIELAGSVYRDQFVSDQRMSNILDQYQLTDENLVESRVQVARQLATRHRGLIGGEVLREALDSDRLSEAGDRTRAALFAQDEWRVTDTAIIVPAARLDVDTQFGTHATPRLAARWQASDELVTRASVGMGYRAPSFKEMLLLFSNPSAGYQVAGNPDLDPETSISVQVGAEWTPKKWLWFGVDAYANRLRDMIAVVTLPPTGETLMFSYDNIGRARTYGGEGFAIAARGRAGLELGYAVSRSRDLDANRPLEGVPQHRVTTTLRWRDKLEQLDAFVAAVFTGHRPLYLSADPQDATVTDRRVEVRARVGKRFRAGFGGFLGIDNALGTGDNRLDRIYPRTVYAGVEVHQ